MFSSLVTATKTRYASLRAGDEADGDTEDDSHISRVLRTYYTEQGRPFPAWLGGGPQAQQQQQQQQQGVSLRRGQTPGGPQQGVKTTLSDIWDTPAGQQKPGVPTGAAPQGQGQKPTEGMNKMRFFRRDQGGSNGPHQMQHGHQHQASSGYDEPPPNQAAQSSIRDRLWSNRGGGNQAAAGRTPSPQLSAPTPPPPQQQYQAYNGGSGASKGYSARDKRDKSPARNGYGGSGGRGGADRPVMSATISFGQDDFEYGGYGGHSGSGGSTGGNTGGSSGGYRRGPPLGGGKVGLPSGPKMYR